MDCWMKRISLRKQGALRLEMRWASMVYRRFLCQPSVGRVAALSRTRGIECLPIVA
jgi:hypothetical protein